MNKLDIKITHKKTFTVACIVWLGILIYHAGILGSGMGAAFLMTIVSFFAQLTLDIRNDYRTNLAFSYFPINALIGGGVATISLLIQGRMHDAIDTFIVAIAFAAVVGLPFLIIYFINKKKGIDINDIPFGYADHPEDAFKNPQGTYYDIPQRSTLLEDYNPKISMELSITSQSKLKAKRRRIRNEKKWRILRILRFISLPTFIGLGLIDIFFIKPDNQPLDDIVFIVVLIAMALSIASVGLLGNIPSHWITDRLNEKIYLDEENGILIHFLQKAFAAGANFRTADERGFSFVMDLKTVHDAKYDPKSGQIEFKVEGTGYHYADCRKSLIDEKYPLDDDFTAIFYDYTEPSLVRVLEAQGVQFEKCTLDFKIRDDRV